MEVVCVAFLGALVYRTRDLVPVLREQLDANYGEFLPHPLMSDIARWFEQRFERSGPGDESMQRVLAMLEEGFSEGGEVANPISVSFLEMLPPPEGVWVELRRMVRGPLRTQLLLIDRALYHYVPESS